MLPVKFTHYTFVTLLILRWLWLFENKYQCYMTVLKQDCGFFFQEKYLKRAFAQQIICPIKASSFMG